MCGRPVRERVVERLMKDGPVGSRRRFIRRRSCATSRVLAANLTAPHDTTTEGDTQESKDRFITEAYDEVKDFPPVVDGKRSMPAHR